MSNFILLLIMLLVLYVIAMLWLRHALLNALRDVAQHREKMLKDMQKRRDTVPYLLEGWREGEEPTDAWRELVQARAIFHTSGTSMEQERHFQEQLEAFLAGHPSKSVHFLEAKKDIEDSSKLIQQEEQELATATQHYNAHRKEFPYSLASAIFGLRDLPTTTARPQ